jgi:two-component system sensor histidine kinase/response regulator
MANHTPPNGVILVVDDTPLNLDLLFKYLTRSGYKVLVAQSGVIALKVAEQTQPDIILLDVMMPEMDGFETCRCLKENEKTRDIPVIFMTALVDVENKVKAFGIGAVDYVTKPFERKEVLVRINTHLTLKRLQKDLESEIAERKKVEEQLRRYMLELQAQNEELDAFSHTVAHNLKNPVSASAGIAQLLARDYNTMPRDEMKRYLEIIARGGRKTTNIIEELLVLASVRQQDIEPKLLDMGKIITEAQQRVNFLIKEYNAEIILPPDWPTAIGYAPWVEEVWVNYLSNAMKYGGQPPIVQLGSTPLNGHKIKFWVKDNGAGLTDEERAMLFTPFTQLNKVSVKGHGLGLSIVRRIVTKLGGEVGVDSSGKSGHGSTFSFTLPTQSAGQSNRY